MKKPFMFGTILMILALTMILACGCSADKKESGSITDESASNESTIAESSDVKQLAELPPTPDVVKKTRKKAMTSAQDFAHAYQGDFAEHITHMAALSPKSIDKSSSEYKEIKSTLKSFKKNCKAAQIYIFYKAGDDKYLKTFSTQKNAKWMEEVPLSKEIINNLNAGLITSAKSGINDTWAAYAPLLNNSGGIEAYVAIFYPIDLSNYPEWDQDTAEWHGYY